MVFDLLNSSRQKPQAKDAQIHFAAAGGCTRGLIERCGKCADNPVESCSQADDKRLLLERVLIILLLCTDLKQLINTPLSRAKGLLINISTTLEEEEIIYI